MIQKNELEKLLAEHETVEVTVVTPMGQRAFVFKPQKKLLSESLVQADFVMFDELSGTFQGFNFNDVRGVAVRY